MTILSWKQWPLALKLTLTITTIVVLVVFIVTVISTRRERQNFQTELEQQAALLLNTLSASSADSLYFLDADFLSDMMFDLGRFEVVTFGRIYDADGRIVADAFDSTIRFGFESDPFGQQILASDAIIYDWQSEQLIAGQPISLGNQLVGAVSVGLPTASLTTKIAAVRNEGLAVAAGAVLVGLVLALLFSRSITEPLHEMIKATQRVSQGDLTQMVSLTSGDELALLSTHFNQMTAKLQQTLQQMQQEIEERKRAQTELLSAKEAAESANRAKSTFLANMSHELRTPLAAIIGYSELMGEQIAEGEYHDLDDELRRIVSAGKHLLGIISDILDLSKIEAGKMELSPETFFLAPLIQNTVLTVQPLIQKNHNTLTAVYDSNHLGQIHADQTKLQQILLNLLGNAAKFTRNGTVTILAERGQDDQGAEWVCFTVTDTGIGIPPEHLKKLFQPFVQVDPSSTRRYEGTGLGLAISYRFCQMMEGHITVDSEVGKGSTFKVHLPTRV